MNSMNFNPLSFNLRIRHINQIIHELYFLLYDYDNYVTDSVYKSNGFEYSNYKNYNESLIMYFAKCLQNSFKEFILQLTSSELVFQDTPSALEKERSELDLFDYRYRSSYFNNRSASYYTNRSARIKTVFDDLSISLKEIERSLGKLGQKDILDQSFALVKNYASEVRRRFKNIEFYFGL